MNDSYSSYQNGMAGLPQNENRRVDDFHASLMEPNPLRELKRYLIENSFLVGGFYRMLQRAGIKQKPYVRYLASANESSAYDTVRLYVQNVKLINTWADELGFETYFLWQPSVFSKKEPTEEEKAVAHAYLGADGEKVEAHHRRINEFYQAYPKKPDNVIDAQNFVSNIKETVFIDSYHFNAHGNQSVAEKMATLLLERSTKLRGRN